MPRRALRRLLPDAQTLRERPALRPLAKLLDDPNLFHLGRRSVSLGLGVGVFAGFQPLPMHTLLAVVAALLLRCNIAVAISAVWISNPLTLAPLLYSEYLAGAKLLGQPVLHTPAHFNLDTIATTLFEIGEPLLVGALVTGLAAGLACWLVTSTAWRIAVGLRWQARQRRRRHS